MGIGSSGKPCSDAFRSLQAQVASWNRGDLKSVMSSYWKSSQMTWVSKSGIEFGSSKFLRALEADFGSEPQNMGRYKVALLYERQLSENSILIVIRWSLVKDKTLLMGGVATQIWELQSGEWDVIFEHAS